MMADGTGEPGELAPRQPDGEPDPLVAQLRSIVGPRAVQAGEHVRPDDTHDEALTAPPVLPRAVVRPSCTEEVSAILALADELEVPVVARGSGTGLSGGCRPDPAGIVVAFDAMDQVLEVDVDNQMAVVQPGVTLAQLEEALRPFALVYPVAPGEPSASIGGTVATNAGGMRAVRDGVTRNHVLGLEAVLPGGAVIRTGGKLVKSSIGYDVTQLLVGSEGTLALVTEVTLKLQPARPHRVTLLAPFDELRHVARAVPELIRAGLAPAVLEYLDTLTMASVTAAAGVELGVPTEVAGRTTCYLVVVLEGTHEDRLAADAEAAGELLAGLGAIDVYVLPPAAGADLIAARERAFYVGKAAGADDIVDAVVPRAAIPDYLARVAALADAHGALVAGCGHVGDGNVHLSVFLADPDARKELLRQLFGAAHSLGGAVSGEHGLGSEKRPYYLEMADPTVVALLGRIKAAFDPHGILGPGRGATVAPDASGTLATGPPSAGASAGTTPKAPMAR
jgi:glycolate oxidase